MSTKDLAAIAIKSAKNHPQIKLWVILKNCTLMPLHLYWGLA